MNLLDEIPASELDRISASLALGMLERIQADTFRMLGFPAGALSPYDVRSALPFPPIEIDVYRPEPRPRFDFSMFYIGVVTPPQLCHMVTCESESARVETNKPCEWVALQCSRRRRAVRRWLKQATREREKRAWNKKRRNR